MTLPRGQATSRTWALVWSAIVVGGCSGASPPSRAASLEKAEDIVGAVLVEISAAERPIYADPALARYVASVGARVTEAAGAADRTWVFDILDTPDVTATAMVGGHVAVTRGMLAILRSEAELAAVIAHEVAHVQAKHGLQTISDLAAGPSHHENEGETERDRDKEYQADQLAIGYLAAAGYDPGAFATMLEALYGWENNSRIEPPFGPRRARAALSAGARQKEMKHPGVLAEEAYLSHVDGLVWGEDPRRIRLENGALVDRQHGYSVSVPEGMMARMEGTGCYAGDPTGKSGIQWKPLAPPGEGGSLFWKGMLAVLEKDGPVRETRVGSLAGANALIGRTGEVWMALVTIASPGEGQSPSRHLVSATAPDREVGRALLEKTLAGYTPARAGYGPTPKRLWIAETSRGGEARAVAEEACRRGDHRAPDLAATVRMMGPRPGALGAGQKIKCAPAP